MSTRANIVVQDGYTKLWFYRHGDGYPEGAMPLLKKFIGWVRDGKIRDNTSQAAGWLILLGAAEYDEMYEQGKMVKKPTLLEPVREGVGYNWECGAIEPTNGVHGDIEFLYVIDLKSKSITCYDSWDEKGNGLNVVLTDENLVAQTGA